MWVAPEQVVVLSTTIPYDVPDDDFSPGKLTYEVSTTTWNSPETTENE